ncbi:MAG TPA: expansin EXLX1 family cellulose-binding protein [Cytophagales bacterium]|nr:expansin EXLX1 family cellulose-binding protein [Cytophagales bacterium]
MDKYIILIFAACVSVGYSQCLDQIYTGEGTYYNYVGGGNCSFPNPYTQLHSAALNGVQYEGASLCGACAEVTGPRGSLVVSIEDQCPECKHGDLDLEQEAFYFIADPIEGRVDISWKLVPCPVSGPLVFQFKQGSSPWWTAVQVRNHRYPISKFEYKNSSSSYITVPRVSFNYFIDEAGMGSAPYTFRVTDLLGQVLEFKNIAFAENDTVVGDKQFAACAVLLSEEETSTVQVSVYPNPSADKTKYVLNQEDFALQIALYDVLGRIIKSGSIPARTEIKMTLTDSGPYMMRLVGPDGVVHIKKVVVY